MFCYTLFFEIVNCELKENHLANAPTFRGLLRQGSAKAPTLNVLCVCVNVF